MKPALALALALALAPALALPGCAKPGPGEETLVVTNGAGRFVEVILRIVMPEAGIILFDEDFGLENGASRTFQPDLPPGELVLQLASTNGLQETFPVELPERGDSRIDVTVARGSATISVST